MRRTYILYLKLFFPSNLAKPRKVIKSKITKWYYDLKLLCNTFIIWLPQQLSAYPKSRWNTLGKFINGSLIFHHIKDVRQWLCSNRYITQPKSNNIFRRLYARKSSIVVVIKATLNVCHYWKTLHSTMHFLQTRNSLNTNEGSRL